MTSSRHAETCVTSSSRAMHRLLEHQRQPPTVLAQLALAVGDDAPLELERVQGDAARFARLCEFFDLVRAAFLARLRVAGRSPSGRITTPERSKVSTSRWSGPAVGPG